MKLLAPFAFLLVLAACVGDVQPETYPQRVYQVQGGYNMIAGLVADYVELPLCSVQPLSTCADDEGVRVLQQADDKAYKALQLAKAAIAGPDEDQKYRLADIALQEFRTALAKYAINEAAK